MAAGAARRVAGDISMGDGADLRRRIGLFSRAAAVAADARGRLVGMSVGIAGTALSASLFAALPSARQSRSAAGDAWHYQLRANSCYGGDAAGRRAAICKR